MALLRTLLGSQRVNGSSALLIFAEKHFFPDDSQIIDQLS